MTREDFIKTCIEGNYCTEQKARLYRTDKTEFDIFDLVAVYECCEKELPKRTALTGNRTLFNRESGGKKIASNYHHVF